MRITMDRSGRIVIPKALRERAALHPGQPLSINARDGMIVIEPENQVVRLKRSGSFLVAEPLEELEPLTSDIVSQSLEELRGP